jgi:hypothetical protein
MQILTSVIQGAPAGKTTDRMIRREMLRFRENMLNARKHATRSQKIFKRAENAFFKAYNKEQAVQAMLNAFKRKKTVNRPRKLKLEKWMRSARQECIERWLRSERAELVLTKSYAKEEACQAIFNAFGIKHPCNGPITISAPPTRKVRIIPGTEETEQLVEK